MKYYLYPIERINIEKLSEVHWHFFSKWVNNAYLTLAKHSNRTKDPNKADYFIISISLFTLKFVKYDLEEIESKIKNLEHFNKNKPHLFFDLTNSEQKLLNLNNLVFIKSSMHKDYYNENCDISIPYFPLYIFPDDEIEKSSERLVLASFRGDLKNKLRKRAKTTEKDEETTKNSTKTRTTTATTATTTTK
tara:strand:+ start:2639 stop:3211 length:573 start_codon:yes stop_codon:yes gene_type:complete